MGTKRPTISDQIRRAIAECGESRYRIAQEAGIQESILSRFMSGERGISTGTLDKLAAYLGLEIVVRRTGKPKSER